MFTFMFYVASIVLGMYSYMRYKRTKRIVTGKKTSILEFESEFAFYFILSLMPTLGIVVALYFSYKTMMLLKPNLNKNDSIKKMLMDYINNPISTKLIEFKKKED